jgi:hypothetical protein
MNVIRHDLTRMYCGAEFGGFFLQQLFQPFCHWATKDWLAVFQTPNQMVFEREDRASVPFVTSVNHPKYLNGPLDTLPINHAGFQEGNVLSEALRTRRNSPAGYKPTVPFAKLMVAVPKFKDDGGVMASASPRVASPVESSVALMKINGMFPAPLK